MKFRNTEGDLMVRLGGGGGLVVMRQVKGGM